MGIQTYIPWTKNRTISSYIRKWLRAYLYYWTTNLVKIPDGLEFFVTNRDAILPMN